MNWIPRWGWSGIRRGRLWPLIREADASLEVALRHVVGVHPENVGVVVRVLEPHDVHLAAQRNLRDVVYLYRADSSGLEFVGIERVHDPVHVAAMVHVVVHVEVAVFRHFGTHDFGLDLRVQNVHHLGERVLAGNQGDGVGRVCRIFGLAGFHVHEQPRRCRLSDGVSLRVEDGVVLEADFVLDDVFCPRGDGELFAPEGMVQQADLHARDDRGVACLHHLPDAESVLLGVCDGGFFHEQE